MTTSMKKKRKWIIVMMAAIIVLPFATPVIMNSSGYGDFLGNISLTTWLIQILAAALLASFLTIEYLNWRTKKDWRLFKNLKRPIMIITPTDNSGKKIAGKEMEVEIEMIKKGGLFNVSDSHHFQGLSSKTDCCLLVVGYDKEMTGLESIINKAEAMQVPIIFYTYGENVAAISEDAKAVISRYPLHLYANFKLTLLNHIFTTLSTYSYENK
jgi:hypothetical protein